MSENYLSSSSSLNRTTTMENFIDKPKWKNPNEKKRKSVFDSMYANDSEFDSDDNKDEFSNYL